MSPLGAKGEVKNGPLVPRYACMSVHMFILSRYALMYLYLEVFNIFIARMLLPI
jgi:hypothetical protein